MTKNKHPGKGFFRNYLAVIAWAAVVMILCGIPGNDIPDLSFIDWMQPDKFVHLFMFGILNFLLIIAFARQFKSSEPATGRPETINPSSATPRVTRLKLYATILTILYGILTEVLPRQFLSGVQAMFGMPPPMRWAQAPEFSYSILYLKDIKPWPERRRNRNLKYSLL